MEYPRGQKCFHPGDESVLDEGFLPKNATFWLHSYMTIPIVIFCVESNSGAHWHIGRLLGGLNQHFWGENPNFRGEKIENP